MKKFLSLFFALMMAFVMNAKVAFLVPHATSTSKDVLPTESCDNGAQDPEKRAYDWFNDNFVTPGNGQFICFNDLANIPSGINAIWIYVDRVGVDKDGFDALFTTAIKNQLQAFLSAGGNLYLCKQATRLEMTLVGAKKSNNDVIEPDYSYGNYIGAATWGVDFKYFSEDGWGSYVGHRMYCDTRHHNSSFAELVWSGGKQITNNNCGIGTGAMEMGDRFDRIPMGNFQSRNNCRVLGAFGEDGGDCNNVDDVNNGCYNGCFYGGIIEFYPTGSRKGTVIMNGLAAYQWINNNGGWGFENTQDMTKGTLEYLNARPCAGDNVTPMETRLADDDNYPSNTTTFRTLHPYCDGLSATYTITSDPNNIARIVDVQEGENTVKKLQFKAAGTITLHIVLTENREFKAWPKGTYEYDREITFAYANPNAVQEVINTDFPGNGVTSEGDPAVQMAMRLHPSVRDMDSLSYTITNHYENTQGEAYKKTEDGVTRLYFSKSGKVLLTIRLNETNEWREEWPAGVKELTRVVEFTYTQEAGPTFPWPEEYSNDAAPKSVITLPAQVEGLDVTYSIEAGDDATLNGNILTLADVAYTGHVTVHASVTETGIKVTWPVGTYNYEKAITFQKLRPKSNDANPIPMEEKLAQDFFFPSNTTTFRTLHTDCEGLSATYSIASDPNEIARIHDGKLQFKAAGTVTLHIVLNESRGDRAWDNGDYEYDRVITFSYANPNLAQSYIEADFPSTGVGLDGDPAVLMAMRLHPSVHGMDSVSYVIENHQAETQGEAVKVTKDGVTRLCFTKAGTVRLTINLNEPNWREEWPLGAKQFTRDITFAFSQPEGPTFTWPSQFETGAVGPNSVITLPETAEGLPVTYEVTGDGSVEGNILTLANVESGSVTVTASATETGVKVTWPVGTYDDSKTLSFHAAEVGYLLPAAESIDHLKFTADENYQGQQPEYNAAKWFEDNYITCANPKGRFVTVDELPTLKAKGIKALWVNIERVNIDNINGLLTACLTDVGLKTYIKAGGNVLLTKQATRLAFTMGRIGYAPEFNAGGYVTDNFGAQRSVATRMGINADEARDMSNHRLYADMLSWTDSKNVYLVGETCKKTYNYCSWQDFFTNGAGAHAYENNNIQRLRDFETAWNATVFGIQGDVLDYCYSNIVEFNAIENEWAGRILTIGSAAYQWGSENPTAEFDNVKKLTANSLSYLLDEPLADKVYTRNGLTPGIYGTICFDYAVEAGHIEGAEIYELTSFNATNDGVILTQVDAMVAGRPYFFLATANELRLTYNGQRVAAGSYHGLVGHIGETTLHITPNDNNYILYNNELLLVDTDDIELLSYRAYINKYNEIPAYDAGAPAGPRRRVVHIDRHQTPTGMEEVELPSKQGIYDIMGRKLSAPQGNGFYIINGKKVIITQ